MDNKKSSTTQNQKINPHEKDHIIEIILPLINHQQYANADMRAQYAW